MAGYSGTPLSKKLGIKPGATVFAINAPKEWKASLAPLPENVIFATEAPRNGADVVHLFVASRDELERDLPRARRTMKADGALWVSWYKKSAKIPTDVTEDVIRAHALKTDLVDVKVCAVSDARSGLKLVVRKTLR